MNIEEMFEEIADKAIKINRCWEENHTSSKSIRKEAEYRFFQNDASDFIEKFACFYALKKRIEVRYGNIFKRMFCFFQWKKEAALLLTMKKVLKFPEDSALQSLISQKNADGIESENSSERDNADKNESKKKNKTAKTAADAEKESEIAKEFAENVKKNLIAEIKREIEEKNGDSAAENTDKEIAAPAEAYRKLPEDNENDSKPDNPENSNDGAIFRDVDPADQRTDGRERIEISKEDLLKFDEKKAANHQSAVENSRAKADMKDLTSSPKKAGVQIKNGERAENDLPDGSLQNYRFTSREPSDKAYVPDINIDAKREIGVKSPDRQGVYYDKLSGTGGGKREADHPATYEQQKREIAAEAISKMSEEDIQAIKDVMQEELDKQMSLAEERGEVYKMPIDIKEAIAQTAEEKSEAQTIQESPLIPDNKK